MAKSTTKKPLSKSEILNAVSEEVGDRTINPAGPQEQTLLGR